MCIYGNKSKEVNKMFENSIRRIEPKVSKTKDLFLIEARVKFQKSTNPNKGNRIK